MTIIHTRTVNTIDPANPYLVCDQCKAWVDHFSHTGEGQGPVRNEPCGHVGGYSNVCPSWSPVDGCRCAEHLGHVPHADPATASSTTPEETT